MSRSSWLLLEIAKFSLAWDFSENESYTTRETQLDSINEKHIKGKIIECKLLKDYIEYFFLNIL